LNVLVGEDASTLVQNFNDSIGSMGGSKRNVQSRGQMGTIVIVQMDEFGVAQIRRTESFGLLGFTHLLQYSNFAPAIRVCEEARFAQIGPSCSTD